MTGPLTDRVALAAGARELRVVIRSAHTTGLISPRCLTTLLITGGQPVRRLTFQRRPRLPTQTARHDGDR